MLDGNENITSIKIKFCQKDNSFCLSLCHPSFFAVFLNLTVLMLHIITLSVNRIIHNVENMEMDVKTKQA